MAYKISGTKNETARIVVFEESDWSVKSNSVISGNGSYEIGGLLSSGTKTVVAINESAGVKGYNSVQPIEYELVNVALGKSCTASNGANPYKIVDGNYDSGWSSQAAAPQWVKVDLGQEERFFAIDIYVRPSDSPLCYDSWCYSILIQGSNNDSDWTTIITENNTTEYYYRYSGLDESYRYIRVYFSNSQNWSNWCDCYELEIYQ